MEDKMTRFAYLLSRMGLRGGELAACTGIDKTLVSRWKNGRRRLSTSTPHMKKIVDYILSQDGALPVVERTLQAYGLDGSMGTTSENLAFWLSEQQAPPLSFRAVRKGDQQYTAGFNVFSGEEGLQNAVITMIDYVMMLPGKKELLVVIRGDYHKITHNTAFATLLLERLAIAFQNNVKLTVISHDGFDAGASPSFSGPWLAGHLQGHINSYFYQYEKHCIDAKIFASVKDGLGLRLYRDPLVPSETYVGMYTDQITVAHLYNICQSYLQASHSQLQCGFFPAPGHALSGMDGPSLRVSSSFVCTRVPSFGSIPSAQLYTYTRLTKKGSAPRIKRLAPMLHTPDEFSETAHIRHIYCIDSIEEALSPGRHKNAALSSAFSERINHSAKRLKQQLADIKHWLETQKNYEAAFLPKRIFDKIALEFVCIENHFTVAWLEDGSQSACVKDKNRAAALYGYALSVWNSLPKYSKARNTSLRMLREWISR